jgi:hypothetical protein
VSKQHYFAESAGIRPNVVKKTIDELKSALVLFQDGNTYRINKDHGEWRIARKDYVNREILNTVVNQNIAEKRQDGESDCRKTAENLPENGNSVAEKRQEEESSCRKTAENLPENGNNIAEKRQETCRKTATEEQSSDENRSENMPPKDSKDSLKTRKTEGETQDRGWIDTAEDQPPPLPTPYDELLTHINNITPRRQRAIAQCVVIGPKARMLIKDLFDAGMTVDTLKRTAEAFQRAVDSGSETWLTSPLRLDQFFNGVYQSYMPETGTRKDEGRSITETTDRFFEMLEKGEIQG